MLDINKNGVLSLCGAFLAFTSITVVLRFGARYKTQAPILADDWFALIALTLFIGLAAETIYGVDRRFFGYHQPHNKVLLTQNNVEIMKISVSFDAVIALAYGSIKLSALFFYQRIFGTKQSSIFRITVWILIIVVSIWSISFFIVPLRMCGPDVTILWTKPGTASHCPNVFRYFKGVVISDALLDLLVLVVPLPKIWALHMNVERKIAVSGVLLLALAGLGASTARMAITLSMALQGRAANDKDSYQANTRWIFYGILECGLSLVAVNLPSLWCFVSDTNPKRVCQLIRNLVGLDFHRLERQRGLESGIHDDSHGVQSVECQHSQGAVDTCLASDDTISNISWYSSDHEKSSDMSKQKDEAV